MLTRLFSRNRAKAISSNLEVILSGCDDHLLEDMGVLGDSANRVMRAPAEFYAYDVAKFGAEFVGRRAA